MRHLKKLPASRLPASGSTSSAGELTRRAILLLTFVGLHLLLIVWLASNPPSKEIVRPATLSVFTVLPLSERDASAQPVQKRVVPPATPVPDLPAPGRLPTPEAAPLSSGATATVSAGVAAGGCALAQNVGEAIGKNPAAMAEIDGLPPDVRTSADAMMLWDGEWLGSGVAPADIEIGVLRQAVEQVVADAPAECRNAETTGPQFIPVPEGDRTLMIVIGSGTWHWADLIASPADCLSAPPSECLTRGEPITNDQSIGEKRDYFSLRASECCNSRILLSARNYDTVAAWELHDEHGFQDNKRGFQGHIGDRADDGVSVERRPRVQPS